MNRRIAYFAATPFQVLTTMVLSESNKNAVNDLFLYSHFNKAEDVYNNLLRISKFNNVILIDESKEIKIQSKAKLFRIIERTFIYSIDGYRLFSMLSRNAFYNEVYASFFNTTTDIFVRHQKKINPKLIVKLYEDGIVNYAGRVTRFPHDYLIQIERVLNRLPIYSKMLEKELVFNTNLVSEEKRNLYREIPHKCLNDKDFIEEINSVFDFTEKKYIKQKYILFDQPLSELIGNKDERYFYVMINEALKRIDQNDICVKLHPRMVKSNYMHMFNYKYTNIPWEIILLNAISQDRVLISFNSTSVLTPKLLFNQEPIIILLYKLIKSYKNSNLDSLIIRVKKIYNRKDCIFVPHTFDELKTILYQINKGSSQNCVD